ncbi:MAG: carbon-phosphorus lyase complex subunit PhnI [Deltaproteobacteria bacterium]|jgi:alpha-D-ribose 1-methylphosphonate 5-triphosphate synthase subunit PhnI|nr:carbon-phosphorus lyase complex subunit PhnI [Deltaproteobacteria bacterium]
MYVAVKGGARAIERAHGLLALKRRGPEEVPELGLAQIRSQLRLAVSRVMAEGSLYAPDLAALAVKQAWGDLVEAVFLLRAARTSFPSFGYSEPLDTAAMRVARRISGTWKDLPGGQILGPTFDYTHRLLDPALAGGGGGRAADRGHPEGGPGAAAGRHAVPAPSAGREGGAAGSAGIRAYPGSGRAEPEAPPPGAVPRAALILEREGILETEEDTGREPADLTQGAPSFPAGRDLRLQGLARADEGFLLSLAYSTQRGFGSSHPFVADLRVGLVKVEFTPPELGFPVTLGEIELTECETVNQFGGGSGAPARFTRGYGLAFGNNERKALSMAMVERALRSELGELRKGPAQDEEFVLGHCDNVEASGFVSHVKLPHYVDFQAELGLLRDIRAAASRGGAGGSRARGDASGGSAPPGPPAGGSHPGGHSPAKEG